MTDTATKARPRALAARYDEVRRFTERLAAPLSDEDQTVQSMPDVSPTKWHRAHTSWFFETFLLEPRLPGYEIFHPAFAYLFNSYYEGIGARYPRPRRGVVSRPGATEVGAYRRYVDRAIGELLQGDADPKLRALAELGIHHEQQHQELLLMDIKHVLSCNPIQPVYWDDQSSNREPHPLESSNGSDRPVWIEHDGGLVEVGYTGDGFAFDNESPRHTVFLDPFNVAGNMVTCGDWIEFIDDGGYKRPELWLSDGWATVQADDWDAPLYWWDAGGEWQIFTLLGARAVAEDEPVCHVSYYEADAYARWAECRLPTEQEWEAVAGPEPEPDAVGEGSFADVLHPKRVDPKDSFFGGVWQWTSSPYSPYPGFRPAPGAVGEYNGKFMVNQQVLRGGCCATPPGHIRSTYRNFFPPSARWPFAGLRLARDA
ncbi:MAG TPA: ergothioneine biosynthesis protein EgtB [Acidimicrobiales bacterium]|nr:ergothioneine biosynthesis protein EgtB [Acidimicrobiales bacterium]